MNREKLDRIGLQRYQDCNDDYHGGWRSSMVCSTWADFASLTVASHGHNPQETNIDLNAYDAARLAEQLQGWLKKRSGR